MQFVKETQERTGVAKVGTPALRSFVSSIFGQGGLVTGAAVERSTHHEISGGSIAMSKSVTPAGFSIGGWCGSTRAATLSGTLFVTSAWTNSSTCSKDRHQAVSFHDRISGRTTPRRLGDRGHRPHQGTLLRAGVEIYNFTSNNFSNPCFRSGASPVHFPRFAPRPL